ncbi:MAG TPA: flagellar FliJ family protein [Acidobacteriota bacterium]|nr:flagellar FliJ family protein [Acidobacteriota bacterium]
MKKFRFPLQAALDYALHKEDMEKMALAELQAERVELTARQKEIFQALHKAEDERAAGAEMTSGELQIYNRFIDSQRKRLQRMNLAIRGLDSKIRAQRRKLVEASRKRKTLDRLKERQHSAHTQEASRLQQQESDDLHLLRLPR